MPGTALVSACLLGLPTRYDGSDNFSVAVQDYLQRKELLPIPVCPEQLAGLPTPRAKCWFVEGDGSSLLEGEGELLDEQGQSQTLAFQHGAQACLQVARICDCRLAILKQRSPSCGSSRIHRGEQIVSGMGVTAALLKSQGIRLLSEEDL